MNRRDAPFVLGPPGGRHEVDRHDRSAVAGDAVADETVADDRVNSSVVVRVFRVLELFLANRALTLTEISKAAELPKATAHRYATDLVKVGALRRLDDTRFSIGPVWARLEGASSTGHGAAGARP
ncbi:helix-turn-helix domain-containing protein [Saccharothrix sp. NPDC042600]|uniref:helix-turn-helix domain-containing protein n=1 Tax=Saccharothrix TaxID=2071 RepID=UPI00340F1885|nr:hypothetical protein GCM10017745_46180 [Saccharothrix mutabilis subsp. capreolus]